MGIVIKTVPPAEQRAALALVFEELASLPREIQIASLLAGTAKSGGGKPETAEDNRALDGLLGAYRGKRLAGAILGLVEEGRTATVWLPRVRRGESRRIGAALLQAACEFLDGAGVRIVHVFLERDDPAKRALLERCAFTRLTEILYMVGESHAFPSDPPCSPLEFEAYTAEQHARMVKVVAATYVDSCDCPQVDGIREIEEVLAGYRARGAWEPSSWLLVREGGRDVGCLLLADYPQHNKLELVYMGLIPGVRGHGWGETITRHALWAARRKGRARLVVAVDAANWPARRTYEAAGLELWDRRVVFWRQFANR